MRKWIIRSSLLFLPTLAISLAVAQGINAPDGEPCKGIHGPPHAGCASGFCLPEPAVVCNSEVVQGICTNRDYNCALPGEKGGKYGQEIRVGKTVLTCQNPGGGRWAQFCQRK